MALALASVRDSRAELGSELGSELVLGLELVSEVVWVWVMG
jgi:hypothetical protein